MASASRISQTVVRPIGLSSSSRARLVRSVVDWRLSGLPVRATTSQAVDTTTALSRGGKGGLAASSGGVFEGKLSLRPAPAPKADGVGMQVDAGGCGRVGKRGLFVQEQDQVGALAEM